MASPTLIPKPIYYQTWYKAKPQLSSGWSQGTMPWEQHKWMNAKCLCQCWSNATESVHHPLASKQACTHCTTHQIAPEERRMEANSIWCQDLWRYTACLALVSSYKVEYCGAYLALTVQHLITEVYIQYNFCFPQALTMRKRSRTSMDTFSSQATSLSLS